MVRSPSDGVWSTFPLVMPDVRLLASLLRKLQEHHGLLSCIVLLQYCSSVMEAWEDRDRHQCRIPQYGWMTIEVLASLALGLIAGSFALLPFGGDSLIELISGVAVLEGLQPSATGLDGEGNSRTEKITSLLLFALIPAIGLGAVYSYVSGLKPEGSPLGIVIAIGAVIVMPYLYVQKKRVGRETHSLALSMDAIESLTCILMALALLGGLLAEYLLGLWWADYLATGVILAFVAREAVESRNELHEEEAAAHVSS